MKITQEQLDNAQLVHLEGEVDMSSSGQVREVLLKLVKKRKVPSLIVDLATVTYIDSSGLATLVESLQEMQKYGGRMALVITNDHIKEVFKLARMDKIFAVFTSVSSALSAIA